jgi:hypothetical protein
MLVLGVINQVNILNIAVQHCKTVGIERNYLDFVILVMFKEYLYLPKGNLKKRYT